MDVVSILSDLVKIDTTNPNGNEKRITDYIKKKFKNSNNIKSIKNGENRESLIVDIHGKSNETIGFIGHIDTVPITNLEDWIYPPLDATIVDDFMYGRGTSDMKSGVACMINLGLYYLENNIVPNKNIRLIFTADEESTGLGIKSVLDEGYIKDLDFIIVPENTSNQVIVKEKGALWIKLEVFGKAAHGARPDLGVNSIDIIYNLYDDFKDFLKNSAEDEYLGKSTVSLNKITGGNKVNIIADYCNCEFDFRTNPDIDNNDILCFLQEKIDEYSSLYSDLIIKYNIITNRIAFNINEDNDSIVNFTNLMKNMNYPVNFNGVNYFTDLSITYPVYKKPFIIYGPGYIDKGHQVNEYVSINETIKTSLLYINYFK